MVMHRDRECALGVLLADALAVKLPLDFRRLGNVQLGLVLLRRRGQFLVQDSFAKDDAVVADIDAGAGNQLFNFGM